MNNLPNTDQKRKSSIIYLLLILLILFFIQSYFNPNYGHSFLTKIFQLIIIAFPISITGNLIYKWLEDLGYQKQDYFHILLFILIISALGSLFIFSFLKVELDIKIYDSTVYWIKLIEGKEIISESIFKYLAHLYDTFHQTYTDLAVLPLLAISDIFGVKFNGYCISVFFVYYLPSCIFLTIFALRLSKLAFNTKASLLSFITCFCIIALSINFIRPITEGYLDVCGILVIAIMLNISLNWNGIDFNWKRNVSLIILNVTLILLRRWYAYYAIGFYFAFSVNVIMPMVIKRKFSVKDLKLLALNMLFIIGISCICLYLINPNLFNLFLENDYVQAAYLAYKNIGLFRNLLSIFTTMGILFSLASFGGAFLLLRNPATREICIRLLSTAGCAIILFCTIQDMGDNHHYLIAPILLIFISVLSTYTVSKAQKGDKFILRILFIALSVVNFSFAHIPALKDFSKMMEPLTTITQNYPKENSNYNVIHQIVDDLTEKTKGTSKQVYVVGDDDKLSPELLKRVKLPEKIDATPFVMENNIVDLRDGFPSNLFLADYVLLTSPFQTKFETNQQVSYQIYDMLLNDPKISSYYKLEEIYSAKEEDILMFKKVKPIASSCVDILSHRLKSHYPDNPFVFKPNYSLALCEIDPKTSYSYNYWMNSLNFNMENSEPINLNLNDISDFSTLSFALSCWYPGLDLIIEDQSGMISRFPVTEGEQIPYNIDISNSDFIKISIMESELDSKIYTSLDFYPIELK